MFKNLNPTLLGVAGHQSEIIELALSFGFAGLDLNIAEFATRARLKGVAYAKRLLESAKVRIGTFQLPIDLGTEEDAFQAELKKLPEYADCAAELGCLRCTTILPAACDTRPYHENFEFHRRRLHELCTVLAPSGVRLAVGFHAAESYRRDRAFQFIHDLDALTLLLNMVAAPNLGLLLDIWDVVACGGTIETVHKLPPAQIVAVQVSEMPAGTPLSELDDKTARLLPGAEDGRINVPGLLTILREMGYNGPITANPSRGVFPNRRRDVVIKQTSEALDKVWRAAGLPLPVRPVAVAARG